MTEFLDKYGPWALITGASSGIGAEFARQLAERGLNLVLVARREERMRDLAKELQRTYGIESRIAVIDLSRDDFLPDLGEITAELEIGLLINNAGFSLTGEFLDSSLSADLDLLHVNCRAPLLLTHTYGQKMRQREQGGIIFLSSVAGITAVPLWSLYSATKSYNLFLAEGLAGELEKENIDVLVLAPGTTRTEFLDVANINEFIALDADVVVRQALQNLGRKRRVIPGFFYRAGAFATRFLPHSLNSFVFGEFIRNARRS